MDSTWNKLHPERVRAIYAKWLVANREKKRAWDRRWYAANREKAISTSMKWQAANPDKMRTKDARYRANNSDKYRIACATWRISNSAKVAINHAIRRARKKNAIVNLTTEEHAAIVEIYHQRDLMTKLTGQQYHVDHILALAKGGKHHPNNLQLLTALENNKKGAR